VYSKTIKTWKNSNGYRINYKKTDSWSGFLKYFRNPIYSFIQKIGFVEPVFKRHFGILDMTGFKNKSNLSFLFQKFDHARYIYL